jgi:hypothetical protein
VAGSGAKLLALSIQQNLVKDNCQSLEGKDRNTLGNTVIPVTIPAGCLL